MKDLVHTHRCYWGVRSSHVRTSCDGVRRSHVRTSCDGVRRSHVRTSCDDNHAHQELGVRVSSRMNDKHQLHLEGYSVECRPQNVGLQPSYDQLEGGSVECRPLDVGLQTSNDQMEG